MALPEHLPTLCAHNSGNYTRVDNVFCSEDLMENITVCRTIPAKQPVLTDHIPIQTIIDTRALYADQRNRWNWSKTDWEKFKERMKEELEKIPHPRELNNTDEFYDALNNFDDIFIRLREELVPKAKPSPHQRRWWNTQLKEMKQRMNNLANKSYRKRH
ncbi:hypothetical protein DFH05DRAFT_1366420, partial [Lentinula detonsa]